MPSKFFKSRESGFEPPKAYTDPGLELPEDRPRGESTVKDIESGAMMLNGFISGLRLPKERRNRAVSIYYEDLKKAIERETQEEFDRRRKKGPPATNEETRLGTTVEGIQPQFREALKATLKKGYATYGSGFRSALEQGINFEPGQLEGFEFGDEVLKSFEKRGVVLEKSGEEISITCLKPLKVAELASIWNDIVELLPDRKI